MGICNGFQILVETGLVPGVLLRNKYLDSFVKMFLSKLVIKIIHSLNLEKKYLSFYCSQ